MVSVDRGDGVVGGDEGVLVRRSAAGVAVFAVRSIAPSASVVSDGLWCFGRSSVLTVPARCTAVAELESEIEPLPCQRRAIQCAEIDESRGQLVVNLFGVKMPLAQQTTPTIKTSPR